MLHVQQFILYLGLVASLLFAVIWGLGIRYRRDTALHARFMVATALALDRTTQASRAPLRAGRVLR